MHALIFTLITNFKLCQMYLDISSSDYLHVKFLFAFSYLSIHSSSLNVYIVKPVAYFLMECYQFPGLVFDK